MTTDDPARNEYLWSKQGPPEAEIAQLEHLLSPYAFRSGAVTRTPRKLHVARISKRRRRRWQRLSLGAAIACLIVGFGVGGLYFRTLWPAGRAWNVEAIAGSATINGDSVGNHSLLPVGGTLRTGDRSLFRIDVARIGRVLVGQDSQVRLVATRTGEHRLRLDHGELKAKVWAPPFSFAVQTPVAGAYDVGCEFMLSMAASGNGQIRVTRGWVMLRAGDLESMIPEGAQANLNPASGPGIPYASSASSAFRSALRTIDELGPKISADNPAIKQLVAASRPQDAITFISLLSRYPQLADTSIYDRAVTILPPPPGLTRKAVQHHKQPLMDIWWNKLPYPRAKRWWLQWPDVFASKPHRAKLRQQGFF